jgi:putative flippase GtrA
VNPIHRWCRFNAVGALGMAVQLGALALLNRLLAGRYLFASAAAVELALLHNFTWHLRFTWRDRGVAPMQPQTQNRILPRLTRFHLSNGLVSMLGNLGLMRLLVRQARLPVLIANAVAILCCSLINFVLSDRWAFAAPLATCTASTPSGGAGPHAR